MIGSTLTEQKAAALLFYFCLLKQDCFGLKGPCQHQGNVNKQTSTVLMVALCQHVVGKHLSIAFRWMKIEKVVFIQLNRSSDLSCPTKLAKFRLFIYSKMEHKINKKFIEIHIPVKSPGSDK